MAVEIGVDESAVSRWKNGGAISVLHLAKLCQVLDISLDWLLLGRGTMDQHKEPQRSGLDPELAALLDTLSPDAQHGLRQFLASLKTEP